MTGLNEIENVYGETVEFYDLSALSQIGNKKIVLNKFADMVKDLDGIILDIGAGTGKTTIEMANMICDKEIIALEPSAYMRTAFMAGLLFDYLVVLFRQFRGFTDFFQIINPCFRCDCFQHFECRVNLPLNPA